MSYCAPDRVLVALSGGVDSSVCVRILQDQGFLVEALVLHFSPAHDKAVAAAELAARQLGVPLTVRDCQPEFEREVIAPFCRAYCAGRTPNPCVVCNPAVKFRLLCETADSMGIRYVASGHYARVEQTETGFCVRKALSSARDQSYMLYRLPQQILARLLLPVGEFEKPDIRAMAAAAGLAAADAPDSQEICFIPDGDYPAYLEARGERGLQGHFIAPDGRDLGPHRGVLHYTVGQRRGLGLALGRPVFVDSIGADGSVRLAWAGEEYAAAVRLTDLVESGPGLRAGAHYDVKLRSVARGAGCTVHSRTADSALVVFDEPQRAPAPGQAAVLYAGELIAGGGVIDASLKTAPQ